MENYKLHKNYFDIDFCTNIVQNYQTYFNFEPRGEWNSWTIHDNEFKKILLDKVNPLVPENLKNSWINISVYRPGERLKPHTDSRSEHTLVVNLNDNYEGGEFIVEKKLIPLNTGDTVIFNGEAVHHGVQAVKSGTRYSLNFWFTAQNKRVNMYNKNLL